MRETLETTIHPGMMSKRATLLQNRRWDAAFTLLEILAAVLILSIIASMAIVGLQGYRDRVAMMVDETNQKVLQIAVRMNAIDTGSIAGSLSELHPADLERAYAQVLAQGRPYTMLAYLSERWQEFWGVPMAEAVVLPPSYFNNRVEVLRCPSDPTPPRFIGDTAQRSYEIDPAVGGQAVSFLLNPANAGVRLIYECQDSGNSTGTNPNFEFRHGGKKLAVNVSCAGKRGRDESGPPSAGEGK